MLLLPPLAYFIARGQCFERLAETEAYVPVIDVLHNFLLGALQQAREAREVEQRSGLTDEQWFAMAEPAITARLDPAKFPHVLRLGEAWRAADKAVMADPLWRFQFGLDVVLDGIGALIQARRAAA